MKIAIKTELCCLKNFIGWFPCPIFLSKFHHFSSIGFWRLFFAASAIFNDIPRCVPMYEWLMTNVRYCVTQPRLYRQFWLALAARHSFFFSRTKNKKKMFANKNTKNRCSAWKTISPSFLFSFASFFSLFSFVCFVEVCCNHQDKQNLELFQKNDSF